jgi:ATP-dependent DNA ligase
MLARLARALPDGDGWLYEPKWDGFRALVFRDGERVHIQSRDLKPLERYFPELPPALRANVPERCVLDGEIVIAGARGLDFEAMLLRIHPAASRIALLAERTPASYVAFDLLALDDRSLLAAPQAERRALLESALAAARPPVHVTPATRDRKLAADWFDRFEGAGLDGVVAKRLDDAYHPGERTMVKVKHERTADCVVAGFRWYRAKGVAPETMVGSLLLGLYDESGVLHHLGITASFTAARRRELLRELEPLREGAREQHPWRGFFDEEQSTSAQRRPGYGSRWNRDKDLSWEPLRVERVCEVAYDHLQGDRFRHATHFRRWRPDRSPADCTYSQLEEAAPYELERIFRPRD